MSSPAFARRRRDPRAAVLRLAGFAVWMFSEAAPTAGPSAAKVSYSATTSSMVGIVLYSVDPA